MKHVIEAVLINCICFACCFRCMDSGTQQQSAPFEERLTEEVLELLPAPQ